MSDKALRGNKLTAGRTGFGLGSAVKAATKLGVKIVKGSDNKWRMDQAQRLKDYHRKTKIQKRRAGRIEEGKSKAFHKKYIKPMSPEAKASWSKGQHPKSWKRQGKGLGGVLKGIGKRTKNVGKGVAGALVGSYAYGKWQRHKRAKKMQLENLMKKIKKDKDKDKD